MFLFGFIVGLVIGFGGGYYFFEIRPMADAVYKDGPPK